MACQAFEESVMLRGRDFVSLIVTEIVWSRVPGDLNPKVNGVFSLVEERQLRTMGRPIRSPL